MSTSGKTRCVTCGKDKAIFKCGGCQQDFCYNHSTDHRQELGRQLDELEVTRDLFRETLTEKTDQTQNLPLMQQIDQWERDSINKIRQTAEEAREDLIKYTDKHIRQTETKLHRLTDQLRQSREENDFVETDLQRWNEELTQLMNQLAKASNITVRQDSIPLISKISVDVSAGQCAIYISV
jgi:DNA repair exonuclease SbcCD ATPase subunit